MNNPYPIKRARRIEMRRKETGYADRCFYCLETNVFCFELEHPVTEKLDRLFRRTVCRNCHRKLEANRDNKRLTKNGLHNVYETDEEKDRRYNLLFAEDLDSIAEATLSPHASPQLIAQALRGGAASLRRKANPSSQLRYPRTRRTPLEWDGRGCA